MNKIFEAYKQTISESPKSNRMQITADADEDTIMEVMADKLHRIQKTQMAGAISKAKAELTKEIKAAGFESNKMFKEFKQYLLDDKKLLIEEALEAYGF